MPRATFSILADVLVRADARWRCCHLKVGKTLEHTALWHCAWWYSWKTNVNLFVAACGNVVCIIVYSRHDMAIYIYPMVLRLSCTALEYRSHRSTHNRVLSTAGYKYLFRALSPFSKVTVAVPIRNMEAQTVAKTLADHVCLKWLYLCEELLMDKGKEFEAELLQHLLTLMAISGYVLDLLAIKPVLMAL